MSSSEIMERFRRLHQDNVALLAQTKDYSAKAYALSTEYTLALLRETFPNATGPAEAVLLGTFDLSASPASQREAVSKLTAGKDLPVVLILDRASGRVHVFVYHNKI